MKETIVLIGGGGHCHSVIDVIEQEDKYEIIGCDDDLETIFLSCKNAIITVGQIKTNDLRVKLFDKSKNIGFNLPVIISSLAYVSKHSFIEEGTVIMHHALVNANVKIGKNCIINSKALIEHDCIIGNNCHISTASVLNGGVVVKDNTFFGSNAMAKENIEIGSNVIIGGGMKILSNIANNSIVKSH